MFPFVCYFATQMLNDSQTVIRDPPPPSSARAPAPTAVP